MSTTDKYAAGAPALGYMYQARLGLLRMLELDESSVMFIEKDDDLEFEEVGGKKTLASLKHKAAGERMSNFSVDFWKSVKIWLARYDRDGRISCTHQYQLFTTASPKELSFHEQLTPTGKHETDTVLTEMVKVLDKTKSDIISPIKPLFDALSDDEKRDFISRITICESSDRIEGLPKKIMDQHMRPIRAPHRPEVFSRLEGWWTQEVIKLLTGERLIGLMGREISDKLGSIADEYKIDNLPITFRDAQPDEEPDPDNDARLFVRQLHAIGLKTSRIRRAIVDYYRAYEQRSYWARTEALVGDEIEGYEARIVDEWGRNKDIAFESVEPQSAEEYMQDCGRQLYKWAEMNATDIKIRERVNEPYVVRGSFHMLANEATPRVYWHPLFLDRLKESLDRA